MPKMGRDAWNNNPEAAPGVPLVPVIIPTRDEQGGVGRTVATVWNVCFALRKAPIYIHSSCVGYAKVRSQTFQQALKDMEGETRVRGFLIDDDILVTAADELQKAVQIADRNGWNIVAPYRIKDGRVCVCKDDASMITVEEFALLKPYAEVKYAGLGFYYGNLPLDYIFHSDNQPFHGEDLNFFHDHPELAPKVAPIPIKHLKVMPL